MAISTDKATLLIIQARLSLMDHDLGVEHAGFHKEILQEAINDIKVAIGVALETKKETKS